MAASSAGSASAPASTSRSGTPASDKGVSTTGNISESSTAASSSSSSSSSSQKHENADTQEPILQTPFEQRRVRHISSIQVRNLALPENVATLFSQTSPSATRPKARRSASVLSATSTHTLRRTASNHTLRPRGRRRTSSVISENEKGGSEARDDDKSRAMERKIAAGSDDELEESGVPLRAGQSQDGSVSYTFQAWEPEMLRRAVHSRMATAFVSFASASDGICFYRTPLSADRGLNHQWGCIPGSTADPDGLDLEALVSRGNDEQLRLSVWARREEQEDLRTVSCDDRMHFVPVGQEEEQGFELVLDDVIHLREMSALMERTSSSLPPNAVVLGLGLPLANVQAFPAEKNESDSLSSDTTDKASSRNKAARAQRFFLALPRSFGREQRGTAPLSSSELRQRLKEGEMSRAYEIGDILRILQMQEQYNEIASSLEETRARCDQHLQENSAPLRIALEHGELRDRLQTLFVLRETTLTRSSAARRQSAEKQEQLRRRKARLDMAKRMMGTERKEYDDLRTRLSQLEKLRGKVKTAIFTRRVNLFRQLEFIYPIEFVDISKLTFSIAGIPLVNLSDANDSSKAMKNKALLEDDVVSSAFGMIAQMVALMSVYLDTPLHYPIATAGSRSVIQDGISIMSGPRAFPLFSKGVERYRFDYGHFLLNKDIEQLMNVAGLPILDIRNTLPNLKNLIVTLTATDQPHNKLSMQRFVGAEMISLHSGLPRAHEGDLDATQQAESRASESAASALGIGHPPQSRRAQLNTSSRFNMSLLGWGHAPSANERAKKRSASDTIAASPDHGDAKPMDAGGIENDTYGNGSAHDDVSAASSTHLEDGAPRYQHHA